MQRCCSSFSLNRKKYYHWGSHLLPTNHRAPAHSYTHDHNCPATTESTPSAGAAAAYAMLLLGDIAATTHPQGRPTQGNKRARQHFPDKQD